MAKDQQLVSRLGKAGLKVENAPGADIKPDS
jgi:hypothetical protein